MGGKNNSDDAVGAATEQGAQDRLTAEQATWADRVNQNNPFGSISYSTQQVDPKTGLPSSAMGVPPPPKTGNPLVDEAATDAWNKSKLSGAGGNVTQWTQDYTLNDQMQGFLDKDMANIGNLKDMQTSALDRGRDDLSQSFDWGQYGDYQDLQYDPTELRQTAEDSAYQRQTNRLDPRFQQEYAQLESTLRNRGLREGDAAFDTALQNFNMSKNDAYEQARLGSTAEGRAEANQMFGQQVTSTEMANALRDKKIAEGKDKRYMNLNEAEMLDSDGYLNSIQNTYSATGG